MCVRLGPPATRPHAFGSGSGGLFAREYSLIHGGHQPDGLRPRPPLVGATVQARTVRSSPGRNEPHAHACVAFVYLLSLHNLVVVCAVHLHGWPAVRPWSDVRRPLLSLLSASSPSSCAPIGPWARARPHISAAAPPLHAAAPTRCTASAPRRPPRGRRTGARSRARPRRSRRAA